MRLLLFISLLWLPTVHNSVAQGTFRVRYKEPVYTVAPGADLRVSIVIDPVPDAGLFSYGIKIMWDAAMAHVETVSAVAVSPPLDFNGALGPGATIFVGDGFATAKGTVNFFSSDFEAYSGNVIATVVLRNLSGDVGQSYPLGLELYRTLGASESIFVTGKGDVLDNKLIFGTGLVLVVPEPAIPSLVVFGMSLAWVFRGIGCRAGRGMLG